MVMYIAMPTAYWGFNLYHAKNFPFFSSHLYRADGIEYDITTIVNNNFEIDMPTYEKEGRINLSMFFALTYGFGFATIASTLTHVALFYGRYVLLALLPNFKYVLNCLDKRL